MWAVRGRPHDSRMRISQRLSKPVTAAVLGAALALTAGTGAASAAAPAAKSPAKTSRVQVKAGPEAWRFVPAEPHFRKWAGNVVRSCGPARTQTADTDRAQRAATAGTPVPEVPLGLDDQCVAHHHQDRIIRAFTPGRTDYPALRTRLLALGYPAARIQQMRGPYGSPVARVDLRLPGSAMAVDVTGYGTLVTVEPFGVPASPDIDVTRVHREPVISFPDLP